MVNAALKQQVTELNKKYGTLELDLIDAHSLLSDMVQNPATFGLTNTDRAYWDDCQGKCKNRGMDEYIWWDRTHLTGVVHHSIGNSILNAGSYAPPTSIEKAKVERLLLAPASNLRSPIYRAQANTGLLQQLLDDMEMPAAENEDDYVPIHNNNSNINDQVSQKDQNHSVRRWSPLLVLITIMVGLGVLFWWKKRRSFNGNHQLLKNEDLA
ncbi:hypothetical protein BCR42DRAFT_330429 [Absidia repens]|uniref:Uncharacterized protein n=1 Tax=Absidia repens TaxID=90262 RepID=A0A1X2IC10_9FUNG|nr:hypothetical protein BCR42DRAFT_330429 [Absidia repens]